MSYNPTPAPAPSPVTEVFNNNNQAANLQAQAPDFLPKLWKKGVDISEQQSNFFAEFEGTSQDSPVRKETDLAKGAGQVITFRTMAGLYGDGAIGDEAIEGNAEAWRVGDFHLRVDYFRNATGHSLRTEDQTGLFDELKAGLPQQLGLWSGRKKTTQMMMMYAVKGNGENYIWANNKPNREALRSTDTIDMNGIISWGQVMKTAGARPAMVGKQGKNKINRFILVAVGEGLVALQNSSDYREALKLAGERGDGNYIFSGGFADVNGHVIRNFDPIDHDGYGPIGSPLNPKASLGTPIAPGTTTFNIDGGGSPTAAAVTTAKYFECFSEYAYRFNPYDIVTPPGLTRYVLIYATSGATAGKWGFYSYTVNNGNNLVVTGRLAAAASGIANTTIGNVTWNAAVNTDTFPSGSIIVETNSYGVAFGKSIMMGAGGAVRGYGRFQNMRSVQKLDGDFFFRTYIASIFGQAPFRRADGRMPGFRVIEHALTYQGINLPVVT